VNCLQASDSLKIGAQEGYFKMLQLNDICTETGGKILVFWWLSDADFLIL